MKHYPFSVFALAPFPGARSATRTLPPLDIYDVDEGIAALDCRIDVPLPQSICPKGEIELSIQKMADLKPVHLVKCSDYLTSLVDALEFVKANRTDPEGTAAGLQQRFGHLPLDLSVLAEEEAPSEDQETSLLDSLLSKVELPDSGTPAQKTLQLDAQLEDMLKTALFHIFSDADFRRLESTLRGIQMLVRQGPVKKSAKMSLTLCNTEPENMEETLREIVRNSNERPPSLVLIDAPFDNSFASVDAMETVGNFSEAVSVPTVLHLTSQFFGQAEWNGFSNVGYLSHEIDTQPYAKFRTLQSAPASRWVTLAVGEACARNPYSTQEQVRPIAFKEAQEIWVSPVWAVGTLAVKSQMRFGWPTRLTDHGACQIESMPISKHAGRRSPLIALFKDDRIKQLYEIGITPLRGFAEREELFLSKAVTLNGASLGYQLFANRVIGFFYHQKALMLERQEAVESDALPDMLRTRFLLNWKETEQPLPTDLVIGIAHREATGQIVLSIRMAPPRALVPETTLLEFEITF